MNVCMHWNVSYERDDDTVTRVCDDCGARGSRPRCTATTQKDTRCMSYAIDDGDRCRVHPHVRWAAA